MGDEDDKEDVASDEAPSSGHVVKMYQCLNTSQEKTTTEKEPPKQKGRCNLRSQGAPTMIKISKQKFKQMIRKVDPPTSSTQKTQRKSGKISPTKDTSSNSLQNTPSDSTNTSFPLYKSVSLPTLDYNIVEDMKKTRENISLYELTKLMGQRDIILRALGQTSIDNVASSNKGSSKSPRSLTSVLNALCMEEVNSLYPPFLLSFEIFNFNFHNCLVDFGASVNVMPLSIAKQINAQWSSTTA